MVKPENKLARPPQKSPAGGTPAKPKPATAPKPKTPTPPKPPKPTPEHKKSSSTVKSTSNVNKPTTSTLLDPERNLWEEAWMSVDVGEANRKRLTQKWHAKNLNRVGKLPKENECSGRWKPRSTLLYFWLDILGSRRIITGCI
ncbi:uncharacterized protein BO80DRAFT_63107 [Aspergillus ibericus CBS 121593]|uniref:Uncharacterized protein n=1 Tax=Aspergillus ibericus CBS 121593 TaxID=1448316 RepID=A0A395H056_9EURO|nr:hypothetical protein BO80DRAFT_63107 [Aspergillus ibericus CBS 121593]RAL01222.1 hypothetical protein BO80DRAFT_63107 [Aspergillus ibericus CBS 121593]